MDGGDSSFYYDASDTLSSEYLLRSDILSKESSRSKCEYTYETSTDTDQEEGSFCNSSALLKRHDMSYESEQSTSDSYDSRYSIRLERNRIKNYESTTDIDLKQSLKNRHEQQLEWWRQRRRCLSECNYGKTFYPQIVKKMKKSLCQRRSSTMPELHNTTKLFESNEEHKRIFAEFVRIKMKNECIRLWSNDVQNMPELLCFLQLFHRVHGPLLINQYEEAIEDLREKSNKLTTNSKNYLLNSQIIITSCLDSIIVYRIDLNYVNSNYKLTDSSWNRYGTNMDVKRLFEIGMFELSSSSHPMKVQPVQCILKANFHILRSGLISEIYKVLAILKKASIEEIVRRLKAYLSEDEFDQRNEIREAVMTASEVITIKDHYVTLNNDDAFFVVTDIF